MCYVAAAADGTAAGVAGVAGTEDAAPRAHAHAAAAARRPTAAGLAAGDPRQSAKTRAAP